MRWHKSNPVRFELEKYLLARHHPGVKVIIKNGRVKILKQIKTRKGSYLIEARYPEDFPYSPMDVFVLEPRIRNSPPHQFGNGMLCLHDEDEIGPETTAKVYLDWAVQWIKTYEKWLKSGIWPITNRGH